MSFTKISLRLGNKIYLTMQTVNFFPASSNVQMLDFFLFCRVAADHIRLGTGNLSLVFPVTNHVKPGGKLMQQLTW